MRSHWSNTVSADSKCYFILFVCHTYIFKTPGTVTVFLNFLETLWMMRASSVTGEAHHFENTQHRHIPSAVLSRFCNMVLHFSFTWTSFSERHVIRLLILKKNNITLEMMYMFKLFLRHIASNFDMNSYTFPYSWKVVTLALLLFYTLVTVTATSREGHAYDHRFMPSFITVVCDS